MTLSGVIQQINVKPSTPGERGLPKKPVDSAHVTREGVKGDFNIYRHEKLRDDPDSALLLMSIEKIRELNSEGWPIRPGDLGENFTVTGIPYSEFVVGKVFAVGQLRLQIARRCDPCTNLYGLPYVGSSKGPQFLKVMLGRRGWYARVLEEGWVKTGDKIVDVTDEVTVPARNPQSL
jgi:MOSC domain-containing protein YiiM